MLSLIFHLFFIYFSFNIYEFYAQFHTCLRYKVCFKVSAFFFFMVQYLQRLPAIELLCLNMCLSSCNILEFMVSIIVLPLFSVLVLYHLIHKYSIHQLNYLYTSIIVSHLGCFYRFSLFFLFVQWTLFMSLLWIIHMSSIFFLSVMLILFGNKIYFWLLSWNSFFDSLINFLILVFQLASSALVCPK